MFQKEVIVVKNEVNFFAVLVVKDASADVQTVQHFVVVVEDLLKWKSARTVDAQDTANRAHYDLI